MLPRLARFCVHHRWLVIVLWLVAFVGLGIVSSGVGSDFRTDFVLPDVNTIKLGWQLYQGGATPDHFDLWLDDLAFSSTRIGC